MAAVGHRRRRQARAGALQRHRGSAGLQLFEHRLDLLGAFGERDALPMAYAAGFVPQVFLVFRCHGADQVLLHFGIHSFIGLGSFDISTIVARHKRKIF